MNDFFFLVIQCLNQIAINCKSRKKYDISINIFDSIVKYKITLLGINNLEGSYLSL